MNELITSGNAIAELMLQALPPTLHGAHRDELEWDDLQQMVVMSISNLQPFPISLVRRRTHVLVDEVPRSRRIQRLDSVHRTGNHVTPWGPIPGNNAFTPNIIRLDPQCINRLLRPELQGPVAVLAK